MSLSKRILGVQGFTSRGRTDFRAFNKAKFGARGRAQMMELTGDKELKTALLHMELGAARAIMRPAIGQALTIAKNEAVRLAPERTGQLKKAIWKKTKTTKQGVVGYLTVRRGFNHTVKRKGKEENADPARYAYYVEFGHGGKNSFLRAALSNKKAEIMAKLTKVAKAKFEVEANKASIKGRSL